MDEDKIQPQTTLSPKKTVPQAKPTVESLCMSHPQCDAQAMKCICNPKGMLIRKILDRNDDKEADEQAEYLYNQEFFLTFVNVDTNMDGKLDVRHEYGYYEANRPSFWEVTDVSSAKEDRKNSRVTYLYNDQKDLIAEEYDVALDGRIDKECTYSPPCPPPIPNHRCQPQCIIRE